MVVPGYAGSGGTRSTCWTWRVVRRAEVDFIVLEQGVDTTTPIGRLFFRFLAALAEFDREMIVEGTLEGLAAPGRAGGRRPPELCQVQLDQAQSMFDEDELTMGRIADRVPVGGPPSTKTSPVTGTERTASWSSTATPGPVRSTGHKPPLRRDRTERASATRGRPKVVARRRRPPGPPQGRGLVVNGTVARIRGVEPNGTWERDDRGYADIPLTPPLTEIQVAEQFPTLGLRLGDPDPTSTKRSTIPAPSDLRPRSGQHWDQHADYWNGKSH